MKIVVCASHVPDTSTKIKINDTATGIDPAGVSYVINPYDEFAVEEALKTKEKFGGDVTVISVGSDANKETIRKALAMGCDEGILIKHDGYLDSFQVASLLANEIKSISAEIVFMGKQSVDYDNSITGQLTAQMLGYSCVSVCVSLNIDGNKITAEREIEGGKEVVELSLPAIITAQKGLNDPRYASLKGIMAAKKKVIQEKTSDAPRTKTKILGLRRPAAKNPGRIIGTDATAAPELVKLLREEAKVI